MSGVRASRRHQRMNTGRSKNQNDPLPIVHIVDDDESFRTAIGRLLRVSGYQVAVYESAKQLLEHVPDDAGPNCILLDVQMPGLDGPELQDRLAKLGSTLPIVFVTSHGDIPTTVQAIKAGAEDFLTKPVPRSKLLETIERAISRHQTTRVQLNQRNALRALVATLTPREREVFELVVRGKVNKQIAGELGISARTIKAHRQRVMEKVRAQSLAELVSIAERLGILTSPDPR
jgi:RNA polymerase sigma factor (sigma-70 family)